MSAQNGVTTALMISNLSSTLDVLHAKRKRESSEGRLETNGVPNGTSNATANEAAHEELNDDLKELDSKLSPRLRQFLKDALVVLEKYDPQSLVLNHSLAERRAEEPESKRSKLSPLLTTNTIRTRIQAEKYKTLGELGLDIATTVSRVISQAQQELLANNAQSSKESQKIISNALSFKEMFIRLVTKEMRGGHSIRSQRPKRQGVSKEILAHADGNIDEGYSVLTMSTPLQHARQLFSSIQKPVKVKAKSVEDINVYPPVREAALPNSISVTKVLPLPPTMNENVKPTPTFKDLFSPPTTLPQLAPPQQSKHTYTRSQSVNWFDPNDLSAKSNAPSAAKKHGSEKSVYWNETQPAASWISYNTSPLPESPAELKRRHQELALSGIDLAEETLAEQRHRKFLEDDALFKSVYSSFAPTTDSSGATVSVETKDRIWWDRVGQSKFQKLLTSSESHEPAEHSSSMPAEDNEIEVFEEAVKSFIEMNGSDKAQTQDDANDEREKNDDDENKNKKDTDEILREISELIEQLQSYQRVRHAALPFSTTSVGQIQQLDPLTFDPSIPSAAETDMYEMLRNLLITMIATLPPFAVAKLNGDQLADLNISTKVVYRGDNYAGTMTDTDFGSKSKHAHTVKVNSSTPQLSRTASYQGATPANNHYAHRGSYSNNVQTPRPNPATPAYSSQFYGQRPTPSQQFVPPNTAYQQRTNLMTPLNGGYPQANPMTYQNGNFGYFQRPNSNGYMTTPNYTQAQQVPTPAYTQRPSQPGYQQRAQNSYQNALATGRAISPVKQQMFVSQQAPIQRPPYQTPNANVQRYFQSTPATQYTAYTAAVQSPTPNGAYPRPSADHGYMQNQQVVANLQRNAVTPQATNGMYGPSLQGPPPNGVAGIAGNR